MQELLERSYSIFESGHKRKDGSTVPIEISSRVIRHPDENLSREIPGITGATITRNGIPGEGARFEIRVRKGHFESAA